jgi:hypothetical protein
MANCVRRPATGISIFSVLVLAYIFRLLLTAEGSAQDGSREYRLWVAGAAAFPRLIGLFRRYECSSAPGTRSQHTGSYEGTSLIFASLKPD